MAFSKLQTLHNQLAIEYEEQLKQKDSLKNDLKEARVALKAKLTQLKSVESKLKRENEQLKSDLFAVKHLPAEHAKLKVIIFLENLLIFNKYLKFLIIIKKKKLNSFSVG